MYARVVCTPRDDACERILTASVAKTGLRSWIEEDGRWLTGGWVGNAWQQRLFLRTLQHELPACAVDLTECWYSIDDTRYSYSLDDLLARVPVTF